MFAGYVRVSSFELYVLSSHGAHRAPSLLIFCSFGIGIAKIPFFLNPVGWNWGGKCHTRSMSYAPLQSKVGYLNIKYATRWMLSRIKRLSQSGFDSKSSRIFQLSWIHLSSSDTPGVFAFGGIWLCQLFDHFVRYGVSIRIHNISVPQTLKLGFAEQT